MSSLSFLIASHISQIGFWRTSDLELSKGINNKAPRKACYPQPKDLEKDGLITENLFEISVQLQSTTPPLPPVKSHPLDPWFHRIDLSLSWSFTPGGSHESRWCSHPSSRYPVISEGGAKTWSFISHAAQACGTHFPPAGKCHWGPRISWAPISSTSKWIYQDNIARLFPARIHNPPQCPQFLEPVDCWASTPSFY